MKNKFEIIEEKMNEELIKLKNVEKQ